MMKPDWITLFIDCMNNGPAGWTALYLSDVPHLQPQRFIGSAVSLASSGQVSGETPFSGSRCVVACFTRFAVTQRICRALPDVLVKWLGMKVINGTVERGVNGNEESKCS
jgi:hypothetical protein